MKKFVVLYHANADALAKMNEIKTEEQMKEGMKPWMEWAEKCGDALVDLGKPLANGKKSDGTPSDKGVVGYSILQAEDMDGALALLKDHPHMSWTEGCSIEVHETMDLPGM